MDLKKAYDSVHWDFNLGFLKAVDLPAHYNYAKVFACDVTV